MEKSVSKILLVGIVISIITMKTVSAQTATPTPSSTTSPNPTLISTQTVVPSVTDTTTPTPTPTPTSQVNLELRAQLGTQSPWNKRIPVALSIRPLIDGEKLTIVWQKRTGIEAGPQTYVINYPKANQIYTINFTLTPQAIGYQRTVAEVVLVTNTSNYVGTQDVVVYLNPDKVVLPISTSYQMAQVFMYASIFTFFVILIPAGIFFGGKYIKTKILPKWYEKQIQAPQS